MFCNSCGGWRRANHKFCPKCGRSLSSSASQVSSFKKFVSQKSKERQTTFNPKSKKAKMHEFVTITIGIGCLSCGVFKPVRGKSLPLKVKTDVSAEAILEETKFLRPYFPDGNEVSTLPGTKEPFTLQGAHTICLGSRLLFYSKCIRFTVCLTYTYR